jgi:hypothetical protein
MAEEQTQNFASHRRYDPAWHFVALMILAIGVVVAAWHAYRHQGWYNYWMIVYTFGVVLAVARARTHTLTVQNRLIRLEMRSKIRETIPRLAPRVNELSLSQLIGLRFASDAELPDLIDRCLKGELANGEAVKKVIRDWQPDYVRA